MLKSGNFLEQSHGVDKHVEELEPDPEPLPVTPEALAVAVLAEHQPDEVTAVLAVWRCILGIELDRDRVLGHLRGLREWEDRWLQTRKRSSA